MTTPQSELYVISDRIYYLIKLLEGEEDEDSLFDSIDQIELQMQDIMSAQQRQENMMNLIIKLLSKGD